jgi:bacterioferritin-associated ferredoxin
MLVCHCFVVRSTEIRSAIARGARTTREVTRVCRAGGSCGGCRPVIQELLEAHACAHVGAHACSRETTTREDDRSTLHA